MDMKEEMDMKLPRVKRVHNPVQFPLHKIRIGTVQFGVGAEITDDDDATIWRLLQLMDGSRSPEAVVEALLNERSDLDAESVIEVVRTLISSGFIEDVGAEVVDNLTVAEIDRYSRNDNYFAWVDTDPRARRLELQGRLKAASAAVIGLGGSGSSVALSLTAAGIGRLRCIDFDVVEVSNLSRQLLYNEEDVGSSKTSRAVDHLRRLNQYVSIDGLDLRVESVDDAMRCMDGMDIAILCADKPNPEIQMWMSDAAFETGTPWSICFYAGPMLTTGIFVPRETPCYRCLLATVSTSDENAEGVVGEPLYRDVTENAVVAPSAALTGQLAALEAIYYLTGLPANTVGRVYHQNLLAFDHQYYVEPSFASDCPTCSAPHRRPRTGKTRVSV